MRTGRNSSVSNGFYSNSGAIRRTKKGTDIGLRLQLRTHVEDEDRSTLVQYDIGLLRNDSSTSSKIPGFLIHRDTTES